MSTARSPVKSPRPGSVSDAQHQTKPSSSQRDIKEATKGSRRPSLLSSDKDDIKKSTKPPPARKKTKSESSDKLGSEDGETQKKSKAELRAERRALQVISVVFYDEQPYVLTGSTKSFKGPKAS